MTVADIMRSCRNFFEKCYKEDDFTVTSSGKVTPSGWITDGAYVAIQGSTFHDGVYQFQNGELDEAPEYTETFSGTIWELHPPADFLTLCAEIIAWDEKNPAGAFQSESFGGYSYTRASSSSGGVQTWQSAFKERLRPYTRMFTEVTV